MFVIFFLFFRDIRDVRNIRYVRKRWTFNLFLKCLERFIKSKRVKIIRNKNRTSNSIYKVLYTGMKN